MTYRHYVAAAVLSAICATGAFGQGVIPTIDQNFSQGLPPPPTVTPSPPGAPSLFDPSQNFGNVGSAIPSYGAIITITPDQPLSTNPSSPGDIPPIQTGMINVRCVTAEGYCEFQNPGIVAPGTTCFCNGSSAPGTTQ